MVFQQVLNVQNRSGTLQSGQYPPSGQGRLPAGLDRVTVRIDLGAAGNPNDFTNAAQAILLRIEWSRDDGATWINTGDMSLYGSPTREWGRSRSPAGLFIAQGVPQGEFYPTHVRAGYALIGTVRFGISVDAVPA